MKNFKMNYLLMTVIVALLQVNLAFADLVGVRAQEVDQYRIAPDSDVLLIEGRYYHLTGAVDRWNAHGTEVLSYAVEPWRNPRDTTYVKVPSNKLKTSLYYYTGNGEGASLILDGRAGKKSKKVIGNFYLDPSVRLRVDYDPGVSNEIDRVDAVVIPFRFKKYRTKFYDQKKGVAKRYSGTEVPVGFLYQNDKLMEKKAMGLLYSFDIRIDHGFQILGHNAQVCLFSSFLKTVWGQVEVRGVEGKYLTSIASPMACLKFDVSQKIQLELQGGFDLGAVFSEDNSTASATFLEVSGGTQLHYGKTSFSYQYSTFGVSTDNQSGWATDYRDQHMFGAALNF